MASDDRFPISRRRLALFLFVLLALFGALTTLAVRTVTQDRELAVRRAEDGRRQTANAIRQEFLNRLETLKLRALSNAGPMTHRTDGAEDAVVMTARVEDGQLVLPWQSEASSADVRRVLSEPPFAALIADGEKAELLDQQPAGAIPFYRRALAAARHPVQTAAAQLNLARAAGKAGQHAAAMEWVRRSLTLPLSIADEFGVPFALYAARRAASIDRLESRDGRQVLEAARLAGTTPALPPAAVHMAAAVVAAIRQHGPSEIQTLVRETQKVVDGHIVRIERALALQRTFPALAHQFSSSGAMLREPLWLVFGPEPLLIGLGTDFAARPMLVAVDAEAVFDDLESVASCAPAGCRLARASNGGPNDYQLGPALPGLALLDVNVDASEESRGLRPETFYAASLALAFALAGFGAWLLWRDVRRELRVADLRSQFVSSVSHELKTPLTAIRMFAETLRMGRPADPTRRNEYLDTIVNECERLTRLLNNVLDFSRIESGKKIYQFASLDLEPIVRTAARAMHYPLAKQGFDLHVQVDAGVPRVRGDADALEQAILNLLSNALKYSGEARKIALTLAGEAGGAVISIRDWGIGIHPADERRIFEKFYRVSRPENRLIPGTGLGLALVDHIVRSHHGTMSVETAPGHGSTFRMHLPRAADGSTAAAADHVDETARGAARSEA